MKSYAALNQAEWGGTEPMEKWKKAFTLGLTAITTAAIAPAPAYAYVQPIWLGVNQSYYMNTGSGITRVAVANPEIADVKILGASALNVVAFKPGTTTLNIWTQNGMRQEYSVTVSKEDKGLAAIIQKAIDLPHVEVTMVGDRVLLKGRVQNQYEKELAYKIACLYIADDAVNNTKQVDRKTSNSIAGMDSSYKLEESLDTSNRVVNLLEMMNPDQINLEALVIEINSNDAKKIGLQYASLDPSQSNSAGTSSESTNSRGNSMNGSASLNGIAGMSGSESNSQSSGTSGTSNKTTTNSGSSYNLSGSAGVSAARNRAESYTMSSKTSNSNVHLGGIGQFYIGESYGQQREKGSNWFTRNWLYTHFSQINAQIFALVQTGRARIISRPNITTMSGKNASILVGGQIPIPVKQGGSDGGISVEYKNYGIELNLLSPKVDNNGNITSEVVASVSRLDWSNAVTANGINIPGVTTRSANTMVNIPSGMTMVIGGLLNSEETKVTQKVPLLGDIPVLGELFKYHYNTNDNSEIMILLTPRVVNETTKAHMSEYMQDAYIDSRREYDTLHNVDLNGAIPKKDSEIKAEKEREEKLKAEKLKQKANKPSFLERYKAIKEENAKANTAGSVSLDNILPPDQVQK